MWVVRERTEDTRWDAKRRVKQARRKGVLPSIEDLARARGMVVRERENSIFTDAWLPIAFLILIVGLLLGRNPAFLALGALLLIIVWVSDWWKSNALTGVTYERHFDRTHVFPDEPVVMTLSINNRKWLPLTWLQIRDQLPVAPEEASNFARIASIESGNYTLLNSFSIAPYENKERRFILKFPRRGFKTLGPVTYQSGDIFTLYTIERTHDHRDTVVVYPRVWSLPELGLPAKEPFGPINTRRTLFTDPIKTRGIRDYQPSDRFRDVHWKATARRGELQTRIYDPSTGMTITLFLNVATMPRHWQGHFPELLEWAVSVTASMAYYGDQQKWAVGLYANGALPFSDQPLRVQPGRSPDQLIKILEALAAVTEFATGSIEKLMSRESPALPWAATLILVTAVMTDEIWIELIRLKQAGRRLVVIYVGAEPLQETESSILLYHVPPDTPAVELVSVLRASQPEVNGSSPSEAAP